MKQENENTTELQVITVGKTTFPVEVRDGRLAVNLTAMAKPYGKRPDDWLKTKEAQRYLLAIATAKRGKILLADSQEVTESLPVTKKIVTADYQKLTEDLLVTKKILTADLVEVRQGGSSDNQGTWVYDRRIATRFAQWLDVYLAIAVDALLVDLMEGRKFIAETTRFEDRQFVSLEDFCKIYKLSPNAFYSYKAHYPYEYIWTGGSWRMSTRLCHYIELRYQLNHNKQSMYQYKIDIDKQQGVLDFKLWED